MNANLKHVEDIERLLLLAVVKTLTGYSRTTLHRQIKNGLITKPVDLGHRLAWPASEIKALNQARICGKTEAEIKSLVEELHAQRMSS